MGIEEAILNEIKEQGIEQGIEKGIELGMEKLRVAAENCLKKGLDVETTAEITNLPIEEVKAIAQKLRL